MKIYLITDTHFGHAKMTEFCGRPKDFELKIVENLSVVRDEDLLIHLGDICIGNDSRWSEIFTQDVHGKKWLIRGNHDNKTITWYLEHGWDFVGDSIELIYLGRRITLSHIPVIDDGYDINIHGHFHNSSHRSHEPHLLAIKNDKQKLLAIENTDYKPVLLEDFIK